MKLRQNGHLFPDDNFKCIFFNESVCVFLLKFHWNLLQRVQLTMLQLMACCQPGNKPLAEPVMVRLLMHICITQPQWVLHYCKLLYWYSWFSSYLNDQDITFLLWIKRFIIICQVNIVKKKMCFFVLGCLVICIGLKYNSYKDDWIYYSRKWECYICCFCSGLNVFLAPGNDWHEDTYSSLCMYIFFTIDILICASNLGI